MVISALSILFALRQLKSVVRFPQPFRAFSSLKMNTNSIVVVGSANVDLTAYSEHLPSKGETTLGTNFKTSLGGKGANQAIAAARLSGNSKIHMICKVGKDSYGKQLMKNFDQSGVRYSNNDVLSNDSHTGIATITVDSTGENTIVVVPGSNHDLTSDDVSNQLEGIINNNGIDGSYGNIIMTQLEIKHDAALAAMKIGRAAGALTMLNPAPAPESLDAEFYKCVDIIIPNETELRKLVPNSELKSIEDMGRELLENGIRKAVIITLGEKGAMIVERTSDGIEVGLASAPEDLRNSEYNVIDTVGAGDSFCGSLSVYLQSGLGSMDAAVKACGVAGLSVRKMGAQDSYPSGDELPDILRIHSKLAVVEAPKETLTFVTGNKKKLEEVQRILSVDAGESELPFQLTNRKLDLPELQGNDAVEVAIEKCKLAAQEIQGPVFTEDTSLCFNALNGMPGLYIKWFLEKCGHDGLNGMLDGFSDRSAYAQTIVAFTRGVGEEVHVFDGRTDGNIVQPRGPLDFGWDPVFEPLEGKGKTYAQMDKDDKNEISHRGRSFEKFKSFLLSQNLS